MKNYGDIQGIDYGKLPDFDVLIGGSPCQGFSLAGKRKGIDDVRSGLFLSYIAILKAKRPDYFIFENVAGLLSSNHGWDFARVLTEFSQTGYDIWWQIVDAPWYGIPQHRERVFILGTLGRSTFREIFLDPGDSRQNNVLQGQEANTIKTKYKDKSHNGSYVIESELDQKGNTIRARYKGGQGVGSYVIEQVHPGEIRHRIYGTGGIAPSIVKKTGGDMVKKIAVSNPGKSQAHRVYDPDGGLSPTLHMIHHRGLSKKKIAQPVLEPAFKTTNANGRRVKEDNEPSFTLRTNVRNGTYDGMRIRYLTPLECERLMGWPDDWTRWGIDDKGNKVQLSDNARYNLIGNGVVPQVVKGIIKQVMK